MLVTARPQLPLSLGQYDKTHLEALQKFKLAMCLSVNGCPTDLCQRTMARGNASAWTLPQK